MSAERVALTASCRCSTNLRSVLPTLNWACTTAERLLIVGERLRQDLLALARGDLG